MIDRVDNSPTPPIVNNFERIRSNTVTVSQDETRFTSVGSHICRIIYTLNLHNLETAFLRMIFISPNLFYLFLVLK